MVAGTTVAAILAAVAIAWLIAPLFRADAAEEERIVAAKSESRDLQSRQEMLVSALRDLEDDRSTDKVDDEDYRTMHARLSTQAVDVMKRIDEIDGKAPADPPPQKG